MSDQAAIIHASADACRLARVYGCRIDLRIAGRRLSGTGAIHLTIEPDSNIAVVTLPDPEPADGAARPEIELPPKGLRYP